MNIRSTFSKARTLGALFVGIVAVAAIWNAMPVNAIKEVDGKIGYFGMLTVAANQGVRLNIVRVDDPEPVEDANSRTCHVELRFLDASGNQIGNSQTTKLRPGQAVSNDLDNGQPTSTEGYRLIRADVRAINPEDATRRSRCTIVPTLEVFDRRTGETRFMHPGVLKGFNPQPGPPGQPAR